MKLLEADYDLELIEDILLTAISDCDIHVASNSTDKELSNAPNTSFTGGNSIVVTFTHPFNPVEWINAIISLPRFDFVKIFLSPSLRIQVIDCADKYADEFAAEFSVIREKFLL
jgi:hypothetical protein